MFIINTDQGYINGDLHNGLQFVEKENARTFTESELNNFKTYDLITYYCSEWVEIEHLN